MQLIACQLDIVWEDKQANHEKVRALLADANVEPPALIVLPEMFDTGFSMNVDAVAENDNHPSETFTKELAAAHHATVIAGVVNRAPDGSGLNQAVAFDPQGRECARYNKMQPFSLGGEDQHYTAGHAPLVFDWQGVTVAPFVCYDLRFPEIFRRCVREHQPRIITIIANWPSAREEHWVTLLKARAIENQAYIVGVNRCGSDPDLDYPGRTQIIDYQGNVLADADDTEKIITAEIDIEALDDYRQRLPFLNDIRHI